MTHAMEGAALDGLGRLRIGHIALIPYDQVLDQALISVPENPRAGEMSL